MFLLNDNNIKLYFLKTFFFNKEGCYYIFLDTEVEENKIVYEYYLNRYKEKDNIKEVVYRIKNNLEEKPKCPICGNNAKFDYLKNHYL